jgi:hypothetical protein
MASIINATTSTGLVSSADNSGSLQLATNNGTTAVTIDTSQNSLFQVQGTAPSLTVNSQMVFTLTSNTNLRISVRGADGVTRVTNLTLA